MVKNIILTFSFLISSLVFSQNQGTEDLERVFQKGSSFLYTNKDSAKHYLSKSISISEKLDDVDYKLTALFYLVATYDYHYDLKELNYNLKRIDSTLKYNQNIDTILGKKEYLKNYLIQKGNYNFKIKKYKSAKNNFQELVKILNNDGIDSISLEDRTLLFSTYNYLASINEINGKNKLAKDFYEKSLILAGNQDVESAELRVAGTKVRLAKVFENEKNFLKASQLLKEVLPFYISQKDNPRFKNNLLSTYQRLSRNYLEQDSIAKATDMLRESEVYYSENDAFRRSADLLYGDIYTSDQQFDKAETFYQAYLTKIKVYRQDQKHQDVGEAFSRLGRLYVAKDNPKKALQFYQEALMQLAPDFENANIKDNPNPKKVLSKLELVKVFKEKLEALKLLYKQSKELEDLKVALATSYAIIEALDLLKPEFESKVDKQFLLSEMYPAFHSMVEVAYDLFSTTKESSYITDAFYFTEKSKSVLLLEATRSTQASSYGGVPEDVIDREQQFRANIIHLEKKFFSQKSNMVVFDSLFQLKNRYYNFISDIENNYPKYYDLKYNAEVVSLEEITSGLIKSKALLSYFSTDTDLFLITIENDAKSFYKIPFGNIDRERITKFYSLVSKVNSKQLSEIYKEGYSIYENILKEPLKKIQSKELIIIPDDILNYLPFDALSASKDQSDYLIQEYQISYINSATLLKEQQNKIKTDKNRLLAYAPTFGKTSVNVQQDRSDFGPLLYNTDEADQITKFFDGKAVTGNEASLVSLVSFLENSQTYNMLHFATHAAANDEHPDYSYLAFAPNNKGESSLLYVKDLYEYNINADLVTLSACQTGLGKLQKGEGMLSLARGFSYAGAKSLVTTLWKINDQTTSELMQEFYKNLDASFSKDKALREAKLTYLKTAEDELLTHPYYWSGFMISGDTTALQTSASYFWWLLLLIIPVLLVIVRKLKSSK
ncbi:CHAT domain-containing protein [uncultured Aquimarina sp.]|uniref:CHAT domain-containing protein n=1 Tax=uncultured Aquimarina sp. TaxID=575652 RepID=UPI0026354583|nr:CHAT domain-containing protein [uncultured Aquimarina sp.]